MASASPDDELETFFYTVSHDLRAPLRAIDVFARLLRDRHRAALPPDAVEYLDCITDGVERMRHLIDDLLGFARLGRQDVARQPCDLTTMAKEVFGALASHTGGQNATFVLGELPACHADPSLVRVLLDNLLSNALKFTRGRDPAQIEVGSSHAGSPAAYFVRDNGIGFDPTYATRIFGVFERLHTEDEYEGTGVGLATVERIVHKHGGRIWTESEGGKGATFWFTLEPEAT